jgi:alcohol dehydrogenase class IV
MKDTAAKKMADIAVHAGLGEPSETHAALTEKLIAKVRTLNEAIGIPATTDVIREGDVKDLVDAALKEGSSYPTPRYLERSECEALVRGLMAA